MLKLDKPHLHAQERPAKKKPVANPRGNRNFDGPPEGLPWELRLFARQDRNHTRHKNDDRCAQAWAGGFLLLAFAGFVGERGTTLRITICEAAIMHPPISGTMTR
jgi:hypothetical protein